MGVVNKSNTTSLVVFRYLFIGPSKNKERNITTKAGVSV